MTNGQARLIASSGLVAGGSTALAGPSGEPGPGVFVALIGGVMFIVEYIASCREQRRVPPRDSNIERD